jgi:hypothetical protein
VLAVVTGVIGLSTKIGIDIRTEHLARKAVAAALAGELGAYLRLSQAERIAENIKALAKYPTTSGSFACVAGSLVRLAIRYSTG